MRMRCTSAPMSSAMSCRRKPPAALVLVCAQDPSWCGWPQGLRFKSASCSLCGLRLLCLVVVAPWPARRGFGSLAAPVMATAVRRSALERPASHSRRDAAVQQFLSLADALARRFQRRFPDLIELDDARQVARFELIRAAACLKPGFYSAPFLKPRIQGALQQYLRDHGRLVRVPRREHDKGIHPLGHQSLDASMPSSALSSAISPPPSAKSLPPKASVFPQKPCCRGCRPMRPRSCACGCWRTGHSEASLRSWGSA
jgi:hypothetical protein